MVDRAIFRNLFEALHRYHRVVNIAVKGKCFRCQSSLIQTTYHPIIFGEERIAIECPVCGPLQEYAPNENYFNVVLNSIAERGKKLEISIQPNSCVVHNYGILIGNLLDKTTGKVRARVLKQGYLKDNFVISMNVPEDIGYDSHTLRLIWIGEDLQVVYIRRRMAIKNNYKQ